ncbi:hypothetical protein EON66_06585 [archaeon]|nr:MAG: hypothetical protein EON66_06585 [archaeon]
MCELLAQAAVVEACVAELKPSPPLLWRTNIGAALRCAALRCSTWLPRRNCPQQAREDEFAPKAAAHILEALIEDALILRHAARTALAHAAPSTASSAWRCEHRNMDHTPLLFAALHARMSSIHTAPGQTRGHTHSAPRSSAPSA